MKSPCHESANNGFPVSYQELANITFWRQSNESQFVVNILKKWNLNGMGVILWRVKNMDKHPFEWMKQQQSIYFLPDDGDRLIQDLANLSLGNTIIYLDKAVYEINVYVGTSENGDTNIDADVLEEFSNAFKRE